MNRVRGERQRGETRITLKLQDWFLPALYQAGKDTPLLTNDGEGVARNVPTEDGAIRTLPQLQEAGFWGRSRELWQIERAFVQGTERITISGFGGQGKTYLATEAGRWLHRTGMFEKVCFVDFAGFQGTDALSWVVRVLGTVLEQSFIDAEAVRQYLWQSRVSLLVILDNLEVLARESLSALLAAAKVWSEMGAKIIVTTRDGNLQAVGYESAGTLKHIALRLEGLSADDAVSYFNALVKLPPEPDVPLPDRHVLIAIFQQVNFHPMSIGLLARQLKTRRWADVGMRLGELLLDYPENPLLASLQLSLDRLDAKAKAMLPKLGVFQGGAIEPQLLAITKFEQDTWLSLRQNLITTGLITIKVLPSPYIAYINFHPVLCPMLWKELSQLSQRDVIQYYENQYYQLARHLYFEDHKDPLNTRLIAQLELPNLLYSVKQALSQKSEYAIDFINNVNRFLKAFGWNKEYDYLVGECQQKINQKKEDWYLSQCSLGENLLEKGQTSEAKKVFNHILQELNSSPSYERCFILGMLGCCCETKEQALNFFKKAIDIGEQLEKTFGVKRQLGSLYFDLGSKSTLFFLEDTQLAHAYYQKAMGYFEDIKDVRSISVTYSQIGTLALRGYL